MFLIKKMKGCLILLFAAFSKQIIYPDFSRFQIGNGAPLIVGHKLVGITSFICDDPPPLMVFTRISPFESYIRHEIGDELDSDDDKGIWDSDNPSESADSEQDRSLNVKNQNDYYALSFQ